MIESAPEEMILAEAAIDDLAEWIRRLCDFDLRIASMLREIAEAAAIRVTQPHQSSAPDATCAMPSLATH